MTDTTQGEAQEAAAEDTSLADQTEGTEGQEENPGDDAAAATDAEQGEQQQPRKRTAQDRIDELTRARRDAERREDDLRRELADLRRQSPQQQQQQAEPEGPQEPSPDDYEHGELDAAFIRDHATYAANKAMDERFAKQRAEEEARQANAAWETKVATATQKHTDFNEKVVEGGKRGDWVCSPVMADAIRASEAGADVAYHLASNPAEARRIAGLQPLAQALEIGRLEVKLANATPAPKTRTDAPEPAPTARGAGGRFKAAADTDDFAAFEAAHPVGTT